MTGTRHTSGARWRRRAVILGVLASFFLTAVTEAAPCSPGLPLAVIHATHAVHGLSCHAGAAAAGHSAHRQRASGAAVHARRNGCCDPARHNLPICCKACQSVAVLALAPVLPAPEQLPEWTAMPAEHLVSLFIAAIDHIPLA